VSQAPFRSAGQIDFSKGFSQWWHLSHTDVHVPSEHTQEGRRYDGEIHLYHWYSVNADVAGTHNEVRIYLVIVVVWIPFLTSSHILYPFIYNLRWHP